MQISIELPAPKAGQKIYVHSLGGVVGGLATIKMAVGNSVYIKEVPEVQYDWPTLVKNQLEYVKLHGGSNVMKKFQRPNSGRTRSPASRR